MALSRALRLFSERITDQGVWAVWLRRSISYLWVVNSSQCSWACRSISDSFHCRRGSSRRRSKRRCCSFFDTEKYSFTMAVP